ncbi:MAG TPA: BTAD domain-containing putative transcriptional regulator [Acidobacteriaceae bacterium]|nr:BTAD domain-containing putative transcriptional regulator [Acidobacteriaceae bacterium]
MNLARRQQRLLLGLLALQSNTRVSSDQLIDYLWGDRPPQRARAIIQTRISELRAVLSCLEQPDPETELLVERGHYALRAPLECVDAQSFRQLIEAARNSDSDLHARSLFRSALAMWRGSVLGDLAATPSAMLLTQSLEALRLSAIEDLFDIELRAGSEYAIADEVLQKAAEYPHRERLVGQAVLALARSGRATEALQWFDKWRRQLRAELGVDPSPELQSLQVALLRGDLPIPQLSAELREKVMTGAEQTTIGSGGQQESPRTAGFQAATPHTLPLDVPDFTGRALEIKLLEENLAGPGRGPTIAAVSGPAGIGKTALCVRVAHLIKDAYPDGQLYVDLRGADAATAVDPIAVLGRFLRALGVDELEMPQSLDERAELYRSLLSHRRVLVVLDNATDEAQVLPLLPTGSLCSAMINSRTRLVATIAAHCLQLEELPRGDAMTLLTTLVGETRVAAEPEPAAQLIRCCGGLPLAVRVVAAKLAAKPHWKLAKMVHLLGDERSRLDHLSYGHLDVRSSVAVTYNGLSSESRRLLRHLGDMDLPETSRWLAAALQGAPTSLVEDLLEELFDAQLLDVSGLDAAGNPRYRLHDLVRLFARERSRVEDDAQALASARERAFGLCLRLVEDLFRSLYGANCMTMHGSARRWVSDETYSADGLLQWFDANRALLISIIERAASERSTDVTWDLVCTASPLFAMRRQYDDWQHVLQVALEVTHAVCDTRGSAAINYRMGMLQADRQQFDQAERYFTSARDGFRKVADEYGEAVVTAYLAMLERFRRRPEAAVALYEQALTRLVKMDEQFAVAQVHRGLAQAWMDIGIQQTADMHFSRALSIYDTNDPAPIGRAQLLLWRGMLFLKQGRSQDAERSFTDVYSTTRSLGDRHGQAQALRGLATCHYHAGSRELAYQELNEALALVRQPRPSLVESHVRKTMSELFGDETISI